LAVCAYLVCAANNSGFLAEHCVDVSGTIWIGYALNIYDCKSRASPFHAAIVIGCVAPILAGIRYSAVVTLRFAVLVGCCLVGAISGRAVVDAVSDAIVLRDRVVKGFSLLAAGLSRVCAVDSQTKNSREY
jgi:hypothetical protein